MAAPNAAPMIQASEIGASDIRSGPNSSCRPLYWPNTPPRPKIFPHAPDILVSSHGFDNRLFGSFHIAHFRHIKNASPGGAADVLHIVEYGFHLWPGGCGGIFQSLYHFILCLIVNFFPYRGHQHLPFFKVSLRRSIGSVDAIIFVSFPLPGDRRQGSAGGVSLSGGRSWFG